MTFRLRVKRLVCRAIGHRPVSDSPYPAIHCSRCGRFLGFDDERAHAVIEIQEGGVRTTYIDGKEIR